MNDTVTCVILCEGCDEETKKGMSDAMMPVAEEAFQAAKRGRQALCAQRRLGGECVNVNVLKEGECPCKIARRGLNGSLKMRGHDLIQVPASRDSIDEPTS